MSSNISNDISANTSGSNVSTVSITLSHAADAFVLGIASVNVSTGILSMTVAGTAMTQLSTVVNTSGTHTAYYLFRAGNGSNEVVALNLGAARIMTFEALSFVGTASTTPFVEGITTATGTGKTTAAASLTVSAGTANRRIIQTVGGFANASNVISLTLGASQTNILTGTTAIGSSVLANANYIDAQTATVMSATCTFITNNRGVIKEIGFAILPPPPLAATRIFQQPQPVIYYV